MIAPDILYNDLVLREFGSWEVAKEFVMEKARLFAVSDRGKALHLVETHRGRERPRNHDLC